MENNISVHSGINSQLLLLLTSLLLASYVLTGIRSYAILAGIVGGILITLTLYSKTLSSSVVENLEVRFIPPRGAVEGLILTVRVEVENKSLLPILARLRIAAPRSLKVVDGVGSAPLILPGRGKRCLEYKVVASPGRHCIKSVEIELSDPLGITRTKVSMKRLPNACVDVAPRTLATRLLYSISRAMLSHSIATSRRRGWGSTFLYTREYREGDELRSIDWKALARLGALRVKVFESEEATQDLVVLILRPDLYRGPWGLTEFDAALRVAGLLVASAALRGGVVGLIVFKPNGELVDSGAHSGRKALLNAIAVLSAIEVPVGEEADRGEPYSKAEILLQRILGYYRNSWYVHIIASTRDRQLVNQILPRLPPKRYRVDLIEILGSNEIGYTLRSKPGVRRVAIVDPQSPIYNLLNIVNKLRGALA